MKRKKQVEQQVLNERPRIEICSEESIIKEIADIKELAEKDITKFCRDKTVELLYGCQIIGNRIVSVKTSETLEILKFLAAIDRR